MVISTFASRVSSNTWVLVSVEFLHTLNDSTLAPVSGHLLQWHRAEIRKQEHAAEKYSVRNLYQRSFYEPSENAERSYVFKIRPEIDGRKNDWNWRKPIISKIRTAAFYGHSETLSSATCRNKSWKKIKGNADEKRRKALDQYIVRIDIPVQNAAESFFSFKTERHFCSNISVKRGLH